MHSFLVMSFLENVQIELIFSLEFEILMVTNLDIQLSKGGYILILLVRRM